MSTFYRIYCETDSKWEYAWDDAPITTCPENVGHTVNSNSISDIEPEFNEDFTLNIKFSKQEMDTSIYTEILSFLYPGADKVGGLTKIELTYSMDKNGQYKTGSTDFGFYLNIRDITNNTTIHTTPQFAGEEIINSTTHNFNCTCSADEASWCIQIKKATNAGNINIRHIKLYFF